MNHKDAISFWKTAALDAMRTAAVLRRQRRHHHSLFFCHLALEKALKGIIIMKTGGPPAPIHNLLKLAEYAGLEFDKKAQDEFREILTFNIAARYDDYKSSFVKKAKGRYAAKWFRISERRLKWLVAMY